MKDKDNFIFVDGRLTARKAPTLSPAAERLLNTDPGKEITALFEWNLENGYEEGWKLVKEAHDKCTKTRQDNDRLRQENLELKREVQRLREAAARQ